MTMTRTDKGNCNRAEWCGGTHGREGGHVGGLGEGRSLVRFLVLRFAKSLGWVLVQIDRASKPQCPEMPSPS